MKALYDNFMKLDGMTAYFPDKYPKGRGCDRQYMFDVANTLHSNVVSDLLKHAHNVRHKIDSEAQAAEAIIVSKEWEQALAELPIARRVSL